MPTRHCERAGVKGGGQSAYDRIELLGIDKISLIKYLVDVLYVPWHPLHCEPEHRGGRSGTVRVDIDRFAYEVALRMDHQ